MVFEKIRSNLATRFSISEDEIKEESRLVEDLMADSLDIVELIMDLEAEYGVQIPDDELPNMRTVGDIVRFIEKQ